MNDSGYGVGPEFTLDTRDPELPGGGGNVDMNESGYGVGPEFTLIRDPELPGGGGNVDMNDSGYGVGPEFTLIRAIQNCLEVEGNVDKANESGYGVGPEFTLDTRDPELPGGGTIDSNESGYGVGPEFTFGYAIQNCLEVGGNVDMNESGYGVGPEFTDTRDPEVPSVVILIFNVKQFFKTVENALINSYVGEFFLRTSGDQNKAVYFTYEYDGVASPPPFYY